MIYEVINNKGRFVGVFESDKPKSDVIRLIQEIFTLVDNDLKRATNLLKDREIYQINTTTILLD